MVFRIVRQSPHGLRRGSITEGGKGARMVEEPASQGGEAVRPGHLTKMEGFLKQIN